MAEQRPTLIPSAAIAGLGLLAGLLMVVLGGIRLGTASISLRLIIWVVLPLLGLPLALWSAYHLYGVLTASYRLDRDGFEMRWGLARETVPLQEVAAVSIIGFDQLAKPAGLHMPTFLLGSTALETAKYEFFAVRSDKLVLVELAGVVLVIAPRKPEAFTEAFVSATRLGSLEPKSRLSIRSNLLTARLWRDQAARWLLLAGLLLPLGLIAYLGTTAGQLPEAIPFGFEVSGAPGAPAPPGQLLLLALMNGLIWMVNLLIGAWFYPDRRQRPISYGLWGLSLLVGGLIWGAVLQMVGAAV